MKKIKQGSIKHLIVLVIAISLVGVIIYPLFDLFICKVITKDQFVYNTTDYIIEPIAYGLAIAIALWVVQRKGNKAK